MNFPPSPIPLNQINNYNISINPAKLITDNNFNPTHGLWMCNYCKTTFSTFNSASHHEELCPLNPLNMDPVPLSQLKVKYDTKHKLHTTTLSLPTDSQSLSERQCYVRSHLIELFSANEIDVTQGNSKGIKKINLYQIGFRCIYCKHMDSKYRSERSVSYPSTIRKIYQSIADMQRFHFGSCTQIPESVRVLYGRLKATRKRGKGCVMGYWCESARRIGLCDVGGRGIYMRNNEHESLKMQSLGCNDRRIREDVEKYQIRMELE